MTLATLRALIFLSSIPVLILTVIGFCTLETNLFTNLLIFFGSFNKSDPAPVLITFHAGQPQLTSIISNLFCTSLAASTTSSIEFPNN